MARATLHPSGFAQTRLGLLLLLLVVLIPSGLPAQTWTRVWADEFDYEGLPDSTRWVYDVGGGGWGNQELQFYTERRLENARVGDGVLTIEARREEYSGRQFTSARLLTRGQGDWLYGRFVTRARVPGGRGTWAAIWMLPTDWEYGPWPISGEIDNMEYVGHDPNRIHFTVHTGAYNHMRGNQPGSSALFNDPENVFHDYIVEWYPDRVDFLVDDSLYFTYRRPANATYMQWPFDRRFHLILNIAVGGTWGGAQGVDPNAFPAQLVVDFVRVYKSRETIPVEGPSQVAPNQQGVGFRIMRVDGWEYQWIAPEGVTIIAGERTDSVVVDWGCTPGVLRCRVVTPDFVDTVSFPVGLGPVALSGPMFYQSGQEGMVFAVTPMRSTQYSWAVPSDATILHGQGTHSIAVRWGSTTDSVTVQLISPCLSLQLGMKPLPQGQYPYPDPHTPHVIPGRINTTDFDYGGQGVAYFDSTPHNQGAGPRQDEAVDTERSDSGRPNVGWTIQGEWLEYTIHVQTPGRYRVAVRMASNYSGARGPLSLVVNGERRAQLAPPFTSSWIGFQQVAGEIVLLPTDTLLRLEMGAGGFNLSDMHFTLLTSATRVAPEAMHVEVYPNPFLDEITIRAPTAISAVGLFSIMGQRMPIEWALEQPNHARINAVGLPKGVYLLTVTLANGQSVSRRVVR